MRVGARRRVPRYARFAIRQPLHYIEYHELTDSSIIEND